jgi:hypothetical protein
MDHRLNLKRLVFADGVTSILIVFDDCLVMKAGARYTHRHTASATEKLY